MRAVLQRVSRARIVIENHSLRSIEKGLVVLLGIEHDDSSEDSEWLAGKIARLRIFSDDNDKMNLSLQDINGEAMIVSQFTLHASTKKGNRPSWIRAAGPLKAEAMYNQFLTVFQAYIEKPLVNGKFGAHMDIELVNDGPVTIFIDTKNRE